MACSWTVRWACDRQINQEAQFMVDSWIKKAGLVHLSRSSLWKGTVLKLEASGGGGGGEKLMVNIFCALPIFVLGPPNTQRLCQSSAQDSGVLDVTMLV